MLHRGFHRIKRQWIYDLVKKQNGAIIGRLEGTDSWVKCNLDDLLIQRNTEHHDIDNRPIYEEDILRDKDSNTYRVVYKPNKEIIWALFHIESRKYIPIVDMERYEVIGHKHHPLSLIEERKDRPFPTKPSIFGYEKELIAINENENTNSRLLKGKKLEKNSNQTNYNLNIASMG